MQSKRFDHPCLLAPHPIINEHSLKMGILVDFIKKACRVYQNWIPNMEGHIDFCIYPKGEKVSQRGPHSLILQWMKQIIYSPLQLDYGFISFHQWCTQAKLVLPIMHWSYTLFLVLAKGGNWQLSLKVRLGQTHFGHKNCGNIFRFQMSWLLAPLHNGNNRLVHM